MKTKLFLLFVTVFATLTSLAQNDDLVFFTKDGAKNIKEIKCSELGELWVTVPVPSNVSDFDNFTVYVYLSTIDYNLSCSFNKDKMNEMLVGKSSIDLFLLGPEGTNSTDFGDHTVYIDLCNTPRMRGITDFKVTVTTKGFKITGWETQTYWDEYKNAYITKDVASWDKGKEFSKSEFTIIQTSLSEGIQDYLGLFTVKIPNISQSSFSNYQPNASDYCNSEIKITDNSNGQPIKMKIVAIDSKKVPFETLIADFEKWIAFSLEPIQPEFQYSIWVNEYLESGWITKFNDVKEKALSDFTIGSISGKSFTWYQKTRFDEYGSSIKLNPGVYCKFYFFKNGDFTYLASVCIEDQLREDLYSSSFSAPTPMVSKDMTTYKITPEDAQKAEDLMKQVLESFKFN
jgi:hypothetical protein